MPSSNLLMQGTFTGNTGNVVIALSQLVVTPVNQVLQMALASGLNTINIPAGTTFVLIQLPLGNTQSVVLKGVTGDTGLPLNVTGFAAWMPLSGTASFVLTAGAAIAALTTIYFI